MAASMPEAAPTASGAAPCLKPASRAGAGIATAGAGFRVFRRTPLAFSGGDRSGATKEAVQHLANDFVDGALGSAIHGVVGALSLAPGLALRFLRANPLPRWWGEAAWSDAAVYSCPSQGTPSSMATCLTPCLKPTALPACPGAGSPNAATAS